jgi:phosphoribosylglycinamide formyltransferase-1
VSDSLPAPGDLVVEAIAPDPSSFEVAGPARGEPGLPRRFTWRGVEWTVARVERRWKTTGRDRGGSRERYVRRHWAVVRTTAGPRFRVYGERGGLPGRWWLHSVEPDG